MKRVEANLSARLTETLKSLQTSIDSERPNAGLEELKTLIRDRCSRTLSTPTGRIRRVTTNVGQALALKKWEIAHAPKVSAAQVKKMSDTLNDIFCAVKKEEEKFKEAVNNIWSFADALQFQQESIDSQQLSAGLEELKALVRNQCIDALSRIRRLQVGKLDAQIKKFPRTFLDYKRYKSKCAKRVHTPENRVQALTGTTKKLRKVDRVEGNHSS